MKHLVLTDVIKALRDEPKSIGDRLGELGVSREEQSKFSPDILKTTIYGSSFLKFLQDNAKLLEDDRIPAQPLPADFKNPFDSSPRILSERLKELDLSDEDIKAMFSSDVLGLSLTGEEFEDFIVNNQDKFVGILGKLMNKEVANG